MKAFAFERNNQRGTVRLRLPIREGSMKANPASDLQWFEDSDYLNAVLKDIPYGTFKTSDVEEMESLLINGFPDGELMDLFRELFKDEPERLRLAQVGTGIRWRAFFSYWKDRSGHAFLVPESSGIKDLRDIGIITNMKTPADSMKAAKYGNRVLQSHPKKLYGGTDPVWGMETDWKEDEQSALVQVEPREDLTADDCLLSILYVDLDLLTPEQVAVVDGAILVNDKAVRALGLSNEPRIGMAWMGTFLTQRGVGKGHLEYMPHLSQDVVIYGPKKVMSGAQFFFGSLGPLHSGVPHTDRQAFVNFAYHREGLAIDLAKTFMREVVKNSEDEAGFRKMVLRHIAPPVEESEGEDEQSMQEQENGWILGFALQHGVSYLRFPGLYRKVIRHMLETVMATAKFRIPMESTTYSVAKYAYVLPDPNAIDSEGNVNLQDSSIPEGCIVFPDLKSGTKVAVYRQPSENSNAFVILTVIDGDPGFKRFAGRGICLLGRGAMKVLKRLGGGDMDDSFVIVHDPTWVKAFETLRPYPETEKLSSEISEDDAALFGQDTSELAEFTEQLLEDIGRDKDLAYYSDRHAHWQLQMAKNARASIGPVVNYGVFDMLLSDPDHKRSMLETIDLTTEEGREGWDWLDTREPYQAAKFMTNLELIIDATVKDSTLMNNLGDVSGVIRKFHRECKVYPVSMETRIPKSKVEKGGYILAMSLTCKALAKIADLVEQVKHVLTQHEWQLVAPFDESLLARKDWDRDMRIRIRGEYVVRPDWQPGEAERYIRVDEDKPSLLQIWGMGFREAAAKGIALDDAYIKIVERIEDELKGEDRAYMENLAAHLYCVQYPRYADNPTVDEVSGRLRNYPDGLLWTRVFARHFINALRRARLTGYYISADLAPAFRRRLSEVSVEVEVRNYSLYIQDTKGEFSIWVGLVDISNRIAKAVNGQHFRMDGGIVQFKYPQEICLPVDPTWLAQKPLTRLYPTKEVQLAEEAVGLVVKEGKPKGAVGKALKKALDLLK